MTEQPMNKLPVTVCIPVLNEAKSLPDCMATLQDRFEDVVVIDSGSRDATCEIARKFGANVIQFQWNGKFPKKRNWALANYPFKTSWVFFLDADERITPAFLDELKLLIEDSTRVGYWVSYTNWFMGRPLNHGDVFRKLAIFRRESGEFERLPENGWSHLDIEVHEHPVLSGSTGEIKTRLEHRDYRGLTHYLSKHNEYSSWEANRHQWLQTAGPEAWKALNRRQRFKYKYLTCWWLPWVYFLTSYVLKRGFLDGWAGWYFAHLKMRYFQEIRLKILENRRVQREGGAELRDRETGPAPAKQEILAERPA